MKTFALLLSTLFFVLQTNAQDEPVWGVYDSTQNFLGKEKVRQYKGQVLYLKALPEHKRNGGYYGFFNNYKVKKLTDRSNIYYVNPNNQTYHDSVAEKYFTVFNVSRHRERDNIFYLELRNKSNGDFMYYEYNSSSELGFPFIVVGYHKKQKEIYTGQKFVVRGKNWFGQTGEIKNYKTGKKLTPEAGKSWKCIDVIIYKPDYDLQLILEKGTEQITIPLKKLDSEWIFTQKQADKYKKKFGSENWNLIAKGEIKIGMTQEMCEVALGKPYKFLKVIDSFGKVSEAKYKGRNLYYEGGKLIRIVEL